MLKHFKKGRNLGCQSSENFTAYHEYLTVTQLWDQRLSKEGPGNYEIY